MGQSATQIVMGITGAVVGGVLSGGNPFGIAAGFAVGYGSGELLMSMLPDVDVGAVDQSPSDYTLRSSKASVRYILGRASTGGVLTWAQEQAGTETDSEWLHMVYCLSEGTISSVDTIYINDEDISNYANFISYEVVTNPTTVNAFLLANCTDYKSTMIGYGLSYIRVSYKYNTDKYSSGIPSAQFIVRGRTDIYDPRTLTSSYSDNSALCILWYMMNIMGIPEDEILMDTFIEAANICDEFVTNPDNSVSKRYTLGAVIGDDESKPTVLNKLLKTCGGQLNRVGGYWMLQVGAYYGTYDYTVTEDMIIGSTEIQTEVDNSNAINIITGTFVDPDSLWADTDYPSVSNSTWITEDGGESSEDLSLEYVTDVYQAQRLAWIALKARRNEGGISTTLDYNGYNCRVGRVVRVYLPSFNIDGEFIVNNWSFSKDGGCQVSFSKYSADIYDDAVGATYTPQGIIQVTAGGIGSPTNLVWSSYTGAENKQGTLSWVAPSATVEYYGVLVRDNTDTLIQSYQVDGSVTVCNIGGLSAGNYTFSVYARAALRKSGEATISVDILAPATPTSVSYTNSIDSITLIPSSLEGLNGGTYRYYYSLTEVSNPPTGTTLLGTGDSFTHQSLSFNTGYHYYIQAINAYGNSGFYHLEASTSSDVSALLSALTNQITSSQLAEDLQSAIEDLPNIVNDITNLQGDVSGLEENVNVLQGIIDELLGAPEYDENEASVDAGETRMYEGHLYRADMNMTSPIPIPTDTAYWTDLGEFTSIQEQLNEVSSQIVTLTGVAEGTARKTYALNSQYRRDDGSSELANLVANLRSDARFVEEVQVRADADEALAQRLTIAEASVDGLGSSLTELEQVVADNQSSTATALTALESQIEDAQGDISANAGAITSLQTSVSDIEDELESTATALTALEATVTDPATGLATKASAEDLTEVSTTLDSVQAQRTVKVAAQDSAGRYVLAGIALSADGTVSQSKIYMLADEVAILNEADGTATSPFIVSGGNVYINSAFINQLTANTITATSIIRSTDGKMVLDFTNKTINITV